MNNFALTFLVLEILLFGGFIAFSILNYKDRFKMNYDIRNHFPYELNFESKFKDNLIGNVLLVLATASMVAFYVLFDNNKSNGYYIFLMIGGCIQALVITFLSFVPLKMTRAHLALAALEMILSFLLPFSLSINASMRFNVTHDNLLIIFIAIPALICLAIFILIMNPKLTKWSRMEQIKNEDGTTTYIRPRYFILAFYEWLLIFVNIFTQVVVLLSTLLLK